MASPSPHSPLVLAPVEVRDRILNLLASIDLRKAACASRTLDPTDAVVQILQRVWDGYPATPAALQSALYHGEAPAAFLMFVERQNEPTNMVAARNGLLVAGGGPQGEGPRRPVRVPSCSSSDEPPIPQPMREAHSLQGGSCLWWAGAVQLQSKASSAQDDSAVMAFCAGGESDASGSHGASGSSTLQINRRIAVEAPPYLPSPSPPAPRKLPSPSPSPAGQSSSPLGGTFTPAAASEGRLSHLRPPFLREQLVGRRSYPLPGQKLLPYQIPEHCDVREDGEGARERGPAAREGYVPSVSFTSEASQSVSTGSVCASTSHRLKPLPLSLPADTIDGLCVTERQVYRGGPLRLTILLSSPMGRLAMAAFSERRSIAGVASGDDVSEAGDLQGPESVDDVSRTRMGLRIHSNLSHGRGGRGLRMCQNSMLVRSVFPDLAIKQVVYASHGHWLQLLTQGGRVGVLALPPQGGLEGRGRGDSIEWLSLDKVCKGARIVEIACGATHNVMRDDRGRVYSHGNNTHGQLGLGHLVSQTAPQQVTTSLSRARIVAISAGSDHTAALSDDGRVWVWGANWAINGSFGQATTPLQLAFPPSLPPRSICAVSCGRFHTLFLTRYGTVYSLGSNLEGQTGVGMGSGGVRSAKRFVQEPTLVVSLREMRVRVIAVAGGPAYSVFVDQWRDVWWTGEAPWGESATVPRRLLREGG
ncbi:unnamed protein product [Vitrella brassicaformis CCMP3155]|uniref:Uncharacterized protein n=1 Tax=Vitrella brassicaformis (strain CCMP3155) TaxID=1169540 RepID=A0A0G4GK26_VITBC|nr:unnamed protein product [Vitrella brassicaformis CCMP3155]|eukprot:CEM30246.1 unnamed protein product [Vitrella brassicaformis CCMP3155]